MTTCRSERTAPGRPLTTNTHELWYDLGNGLLHRYTQHSGSLALWRGTLRVVDNRANDLFNQHVIDVSATCYLPGEVPDA